MKCEHAEAGGQNDVAGKEDGRIIAGRMMVGRTVWQRRRDGSRGPNDVAGKEDGRMMAGQIV